MGKFAYIRLILEAKFGDDSLFKPVELAFDVEMILYLNLWSYLLMHLKDQSNLHLSPFLRGVF